MSTLGGGTSEAWLVNDLEVADSQIKPEKETPMLLELLRIGAAFGLAALFVVCWYWFMDSVGTF